MAPRTDSLEILLDGCEKAATRSGSSSIYNPRGPSRLHILASDCSRPWRGATAPRLLLVPQQRPFLDARVWCSTAPLPGCACEERGDSAPPLVTTQPDEDWCCVKGEPAYPFWCWQPRPARVVVGGRICPDSLIGWLGEDQTDLFTGRTSSRHREDIVSTG